MEGGRGILPRHFAGRRGNEAGLPADSPRPRPPVRANGLGFSHQVGGRGGGGMDIIMTSIGTHSLISGTLVRLANTLTGVCLLRVGNLQFLTSFHHDRPSA